MPRITGFIIAGMLGLITLPAQGAERGSGQVHAASGSTTTSRTRSPKPPSVGSGAPAPVTAHKKAAASTATVSVGGGAGEVPDPDPLEDNDPVQDLIPVADYISPPTASHSAPQPYDQIESHGSRISSSGALQAGSDAERTTAAATSDGRWTRIDAASSQAQGQLNNQPEYQAAVARLVSAEQKLAALRGGGVKDSDQLRLAAQEVLKATDAIARMRMSALEADPGFLAALDRD